MKRTILSVITVALALILLVADAAGAQESGLTLRLNRDFGFAAGGQIQGTFSFRVEGPDSLERVVFLIDDREIGQDTEAPFRMQFKTEGYELGAHTLSAVGYTREGDVLQSNRLTREFVSPRTTGRFLVWVVVPILVLSLGGTLLTAWLANRDKPAALRAISGPLGGTICPACGRPYALHLWSINLAAFRLDRCPHCGSWRRVRRASPAALAAAAEALNAAEKQAAPPADDADSLRRQLDDSRFEDTG